MTLDEHLNGCMAERAGLGVSGAEMRFKQALKDNPALVEQAGIRLRHYDSPAGRSILQRDHVSRVHEVILRKAMANV